MLERRRTRRDGKCGHTGWAVIGKQGAIEFWFTEHPLGEGYDKIGGIETHSRTPLYDESAPPDHQDCPLIGRCWHDGSSLWASEHWIPLYESLGEDWVWSALEETYHKTWGRDDVETD